MTDPVAAPLAPEDLYEGEILKEIQQYIDILGTRGIDWGLLGPREGERIFSRHVLNSVAVESLIPQGVDVVDVGSGAGLPGIPLAIVRPDLHITLLEPLLRRVTFLEDAVEELGLAERVEVVRGRAEEVRKRHFDVVTCRAVAPLERLLGWTTPLFLPDGELLALKGASAADEIDSAARRLERQRLTAEVLQVRASASAEPTSVVRVRKE